ncbi:MAG: CrcB family protein [Vicinamibacterales bacterium]
MSRLCWICLAGAAGTGTRYLVALWAAQRFGSSFPVGTLIVNLAGCFVMAFLMQTAISLAWSPTLRSALTIGYLGGLTTYSSFNYETTRMFQEGASGLALVNAGATILGGLVAGWLGLVLARELAGQ